MSTTKIPLNRPQFEFLQLPKKIRAFVAGFGTGKTFVGSIGTCQHFAEYPKINTGYFAPTYSHIRDIYYPTIEEVVSLFGQRVEIKEGNKEAHHYYGRSYIGTTICRSMDNPNRIVGFKIGRAHIDEPDILPMNKMLNAYRKILARMRYNVSGMKNGIDLTTTPEGYKFTYEIFEKKKTESTALIQASTYENEKNLPADYIPTLLETYPQELITAYLNGKFVNLTSGSVYKNYDRTVCRSTEQIKEKEPLFIGQDFNVGNMFSAIFVRREKDWHCVSELKGVYDTPALIATLKEKFPDRLITIYPDASGKNRKTSDASTSDISLLQQAGFNVRVNKSNPFVKDRVLSVNTAFSKRKLFINDSLAPDVAESLEKQAYDKNGEPDKTSGFDHACDAFGYLVSYEMPINKPVIVTNMRMVR